VVPYIKVDLCRVIESDFISRNRSLPSLAIKLPEGTRLEPFCKLETFCKLEPFCKLETFCKLEPFGKLEPFCKLEPFGKLEPFCKNDLSSDLLARVISRSIARLAALDSENAEQEADSPPAVPAVEHLAEFLPRRA
jgi:hypothetical protein